MAVIKATILKTEVDFGGVAHITVEFDDQVGKWTKTYEYKQTDPIDFSKFKMKIEGDIKKDLKIKDQLVNIKKEIGKSFNITI